MSKVIKAAGGIVWRKALKGSQPSVEILLVHRPRYDDWTFPKGKVEAGEALPATAVREVFEETNEEIRLAHPLPLVEYRVKGGMKKVSYWTARPLKENGPFAPNTEVDESRWMTLRQARKHLTYDHDVALLEAFEDLIAAKRHRTRTLIVLRHAQAVPRADFAGDDEERPLTQAGLERAAHVSSVLKAFGIRRVVSSPAVRCTQTVDPFLSSSDFMLEVDRRFSEDTSSSRIERAIERVVVKKRPTVIVTHRPTIPLICESFGLEPVSLSPGEGLVIHHRRGRIHATERF